MKARFYALAGRLEGALRTGETLLLGLDAERSDFVRFNRGRVRQAGSVEQRTLELRLLRAGRQASATLELGESSGDVELAQDALAQLRDRPWHLLVAGDGDARAAVAAALDAAAPGRATLLGALDTATLAATCAAGDLFVWPAVNEAYGMAMLEAQAAGLPVVSCALRGVPDVVRDGRTGLLAPPEDPAAFAALVGALLDDAPRRRALGEAAAAFVQRERTLEAAARTLNGALAPLTAAATPAAAKR